MDYEDVFSIAISHLDFIFNNLMKFKEDHYLMGTIICHDYGDLELAALLESFEAEKNHILWDSIQWKHKTTLSHQDYLRWGKKFVKDLSKKHNGMVLPDDDENPNYWHFYIES